jgi:hypothetical protein
MALPIEIQQTDALHSYALTPVSNSLLGNSNFFQSWVDTLRNFWLLLPDYLVAVMLRLFFFSFILSLVLLFWVIWLANNMQRARRQMLEDLNLPNTPGVKESNAIPEVVNEKWQKVLVHINSTNPSDWKLAILQCDIMLSDILEKMGYMQESIGEKLKSIEPSDFTNIENAWEAHKIRNQIAHEGSDFMMNEREAKRVVGLYETVFREFEYI